MEKKFSVKKYFLYLLAVGSLCLLAVGIDRAAFKSYSGKKLEQVISSLTYAADSNGAEIQLLQDFSPALEDMGHGEQAVYYRMLTKLYILRNDMDKAMLNFVDAQIHAEIAKDYPVIAWLYADIAQVYIEYDADTLALTCINTALDYAGDSMEDFFYEYCYVTKGEVEARLGKTEDAFLSYKKSLEYNAPDQQEYQSMDLRRNLILANIALETGDGETVKEQLGLLKDYIEALEYPPVDALWSSGIYYPYLTLQTRYALQTEAYGDAMGYMDEMFTTGMMYGQISSLMTFLNDIIGTMENMENSGVSEDLAEKIEETTRKLVLEYPDAFQNRNAIASTHIYNSNMITVAVFVQQYQMENLYKMIGEGAAIVVLVVALLVLLIRRSERRGRIDGLTGAYIRRYFDEVYMEQKGGAGEFGIIMYDIDYFKQINDGFGHEAGDRVLKDTARLVMGFLDRKSRLFRYGGDEFCILCKKKSLEDMAELAEKIRSSVEALKWKEGFKISFSMGAAHSGESMERDVMAKVDEKLYRSKEAGRNHVSW